MKIIKPSFSIEDSIDGEQILKSIERAGRTAYKTEERISSDSAKKFVKSLIERGHESVIEHEKITVKIICDRGVTHEIVRHRLASYTQESTRYCNYTKDKFGQEITVINPPFWQDTSDLSERAFNRGKRAVWLEAMQKAEEAYMTLIKLGATPEEARSVLPNSLKTEIMVTMNLREWRHFFKLRTAKAAHPQMREIAQPLLEEFKRRIPVIFDDISC